MKTPTRLIVNIHQPGRTSRSLRSRQRSKWWQFALTTLCGITLSWAGTDAVSTVQNKPSPGTVDPALRAAFEADLHALQPVQGKAGAYQTVNPQNQLQFAITKDAVQVSPLASGDAWNFTMSLTGFGRGQAIQPVSRGGLSIARNRAEMDHNGGSLVEWYLHEARGLEQGFTVKTRPAGDDAPLNVVVTVGGDVRPVTASSKGESLKFINKDNQTVLNYSHLVAWDADGKTLPSRMEAKDGRIILSVDDAGAKYPVTIDPLTWVEEQLFDNPNPASGDLYGHSVSVRGDTAAVGAPGDDGMLISTPATTVANSGKVYIYTRTGVTWTLQAEFCPDDAANGDEFGHSVALGGPAGDILVVGAKGNNSGAGAVYLFNRVGTTWSLTQKLVSDDPSNNDNFGHSLAFSETSLVIGAPGDDTASNNNRGSMYIFEPIAGVWTEVFEYYGQADSDYFGGYPNSGDGMCVAVCPLSGDWAFAGSAKGNGGLGYVEIFHRVAGVWSWFQTVQASDGIAGDEFGISVATCGGYALIGAHRADVGAESSAGVVYAFGYNGTNWVQQAKLASADANTNDNFGDYVAISGRIAVISAPGDNHGKGGDSGCLYIFVRSLSGVWSFADEIEGGSDTDHDDHFGAAALMSGDTLIIGAPGKDVGGGTNRGGVYFFRLNLDIGILTDDEFAAFHDYSINQSGRIVFHAQVKKNVITNTTPLPLTADEVICSDGYAPISATLEGDSSLLSRLIYEGDPIPGPATPGGGNMSRTFPEFRLQDSGMSYFLGRATGYDYTRDYFELVDNGTDVGTYAREGPESLSGDGYHYNIIYPGLAQDTDSQTAFFCAQLRTGNGVTSANDTAVFRVQGDSSIGTTLAGPTLWVREGTVNPAGMAGVKLGNIAPYVVAADNGTIAFSGYLLNNPSTSKSVTSLTNMAVFKAVPPAPGDTEPTLVKVVQRGASDPDTGGHFYLFGGQAINPAGRVLIKANLRILAADSVTSATDEGLWREDQGGALHLVLREGQAIDGAILNRVVRYWYLADDSVVAQCLLRGSGVNAYNDLCIVHVPAGGSPAVIAREGNPISELSGSEPSWIMGFDVSPTSGYFTILASLKANTGDTSYVNNAVVLRGQVGVPGMETVLRNGDILRLRGSNRTIGGFAMSPGGVQRVTGGAGGHGRIINDLGDIGIIIKFRGAFLQGIFVWPVIPSL